MSGYDTIGSSNVTKESVVEKFIMLQKNFPYRNKSVFSFISKKLKRISAYDKRSYNSHFSEIYLCNFIVFGNKRIIFVPQAWISIWKKTTFIPSHQLLNFIPPFQIFPSGIGIV